MSATVLYMSMSVDGFVAGPNERLDNGLGDGGMRLHRWFIPEPADGVNREVVDEWNTTGAVITGRRTFELGRGWRGDHHDGVPIFVFSRNPPPPEAKEWPLVSYVGDIAEAARLAKEAAGDRNVLVHGIGTTRLALQAGVLDELQIHLVPVLLGQGRLLFDDLPPDHVELELIDSRQGEGVLHLRYRVRTAAE